MLFNLQKKIIMYGIRQRRMESILFPTIHCSYFATYNSEEALKGIKKNDSKIVEKGIEKDKDAMKRIVTLPQFQLFKTDFPLF